MTKAAYVELLPWDAPRDVWLARRREGVGGSEIAGVLGLSTWESPWSLWHRKRGLIDEADENDWMRWGRRLEATVAAEFVDRHPDLRVARVGLLASRARPWQMATPDRLITPRVDVGAGGGPTTGLECKTANDWDGWGDEGTADIPVAYRCQVLWCMDVLGVDTWHLAVLARGHDYREYFVRRDQAAEDDLAVMRDRAREFLALEESPPLDGHPATTKGLKNMYSDVIDENVIVPDRTARRYAAARARVKRAELHLAWWENCIRDTLGDAKRAVTKDGATVATRSVYPRRSVDTKAFYADEPELAAKYRKETIVNQLRGASTKKAKGKIR